MTDPTDTYVIGGAGLAIENSDNPFNHGYPPRGFQKQALDWIYEDETPPVAALAAPTGGGKTDVITAIGEATNQVLCVYPTNALIKAQTDELRDAGLSVAVITGETLSGSGTERSDQLLNIAQRGQRGGQDVVVTNPDVLQSVIQNLYFSPGSRILTIFAQFDAAVYDEFHYYDPLAASGLLTQIKILSERGAYRTKNGRQLPKFLLSSATPSTTFIEYISDELELDLQDIRSTLYPLDIGANQKAPTHTANLVYHHKLTGSTEAEQKIATLRHSDSKRDVFDSGLVESPPDDVSRFRHPMFVRRHQGWIGDSFPAIADQLAATIHAEYERDEPVAAVIFNSAAQSNAFQEYLVENRTELAAKITKDNGYDTNAARTVPTETVGLNTTSKGEVGLNFDLKRLVMATPHTGSAFIQRIGRAARQSPAIVDLYGLADPGWPPVQCYPNFLARVAQSLSDADHHRKQLRHLTGMRAAYALHTRLAEDDQYHTDSIFEDFRGFPTEPFWESFFRDLANAREILESDPWDSVTTTTLDRQTSSLLRGATAAQSGIASLRGRTVSHPVYYPRDGGIEKTEYDLISALSHYAIEDVCEEGGIELTDKQPPGSLRGYFAGEPNGGDGIDLTQSYDTINEQLQDGYLNLLKTADCSAIELDPDKLSLFFSLLPLSSALIPDWMATDLREIDCDTETGVVSEINNRE
jgi:CRISPR-associated endonuclease/helicase Cas3